MPSVVEQTDAGAVFSLLVDEHPVGILRALWQADGPLSFSALHDAVDIDDSGQFNYHLDKLVGQFVQKSDVGYSLAEPGRQINGAIDGGSFTTSGSMAPIKLDPPCPTCGGQRTLEYEDDRLRVECTSCDTVVAFGVPPAAFADRDRAEIPAVAGKYLLSELTRLEHGFCPYCHGRAERHVTAASSDEQIPIVVYECQQCGAEPTSGLSLSLITPPAVVAFYHDHGVDIRDRSVWEFQVPDDESESIESNEPFRASVIFSTDNEELKLTVDDNGDVRSAERCSELSE